MASKYRRLDETLEDLGLKPAPDFARIVDLAWSLQLRRTRAGKASAPVGAVSCASLFFACGQVDPDIGGTLKKVDFDFAKFGAEMGAADFDPEQTQLRLRPILQKRMLFSSWRRGRLLGDPPVNLLRERPCKT